MTRDQFIAAHFHKLNGMVCDAAIRERRGGDLSLFLKMMTDVLEMELGKMYDELNGGKVVNLPPAQNGVAPQQAAVRRP